jgi:DNA processing protein
LIPEAAERSGSLHTAAFMLDLGRPVLAVPGSILSPLSAGTNKLIQSGATPITNAQDIMTSLGYRLKTARPVAGTSSDPAGDLILEALRSGINDGDILLQTVGLSPAVFSHALTMLEISGRVYASAANQWYIR